MSYNHRDNTWMRYEYPSSDLSRSKQMSARKQRCRQEPSREYSCSSSGQTFVPNERRAKPNMSRNKFSHHMTEECHNSYGYGHNNRPIIVSNSVYSSKHQPRNSLHKYTESKGKNVQNDRSKQVYFGRENYGHNMPLEYVKTRTRNSQKENGANRHDPCYYKNTKSIRKCIGTESYRTSSSTFKTRDPEPKYYQEKSIHERNNPFKAKPYRMYSPKFEKYNQGSQYLRNLKCHKNQSVFMEENRELLKEIHALLLSEQRYTNTSTAMYNPCVSSSHYSNNDSIKDSISCSKQCSEKDRILLKNINRLLAFRIENQSQCPTQCLDGDSIDLDSGLSSCNVCRDDCTCKIDLDDDITILSPSIDFMINEIEETEEELCNTRNTTGTYQANEDRISESTYNNPKLSRQYLLPINVRYIPRSALKSKKCRPTETSQEKGQDNSDSSERTKHNLINSASEPNDRHCLNDVTYTIHSNLKPSNELNSEKLNHNSQIIDGDIEAQDFSKSVDDEFTPGTKNDTSNSQLPNLPSDRVTQNSETITKENIIKSLQGASEHGYVDLMRCHFENPQDRINKYSLVILIIGLFILIMYMLLSSVQYTTKSVTHTSDNQEDIQKLQSQQMGSLGNVVQQQRFSEKESNNDKNQEIYVSNSEELNYDNTNEINNAEKDILENRRQPATKDEEIKHNSAEGIRFAETNLEQADTSDKSDKKTKINKFLKEIVENTKFPHAESLKQVIKDIVVGISEIYGNMCDSPGRKNTKDYQNDQEQTLFWKSNNQKSLGSGCHDQKSHQGETTEIKHEQSDTLTTEDASKTSILNKECGVLGMFFNKDCSNVNPSDDNMPDCA